MERGGLGLICVATKAECLLLRQSLRILQRREENCYRHLGYWTSKNLEDEFPDLGAKGPQCPALTPQFPLHKVMMESLQEGLIREEYNPAALYLASTKTIYASRSADIIPPPKIEAKHPTIDFKGVVYPRLAYSILEPEPKDILFCLTHNLQPNRERLFEQNRVHNPACPLPQCQGQVQDREHLFCSCYLVSEAWLWVRSKLLQLLPNTVQAVITSGEDFIMMKFPKDTMDKELVWLIGNYCDIVKKVSLEKKRKLGAGQVAGIVRTRLLTLRQRAVVQPLIFNI